MARRTAIKWLHWISLALILYFFAVEPEDVRRLGAAALTTHAGIGVIFGTVVAIWFAMFAVKGLAGRAGPKLPGWAKTAHPLAHKTMYWLLLAMTISGGLIGLFAPYIVLAFGLFPIAPSLNVGTLHGAMQEVHEVVFNVLLAAIIGHAGFHIWRHLFIKDNALRIMVPQRFHKYL